MLEVGVEPAVQDRVCDGAQHGEGVNDEEEGQLEIGLDRRFVVGFAESLETWKCVIQVYNSGHDLFVLHQLRYLNPTSQIPNFHLVGRFTVKTMNPT